MAALGGLLFGYDTAVISGAVGSIDADFIAPLQLSETWRDTLSGLAVSGALFGCIIGSAPRPAPSPTGSAARSG